MTIESRYDPSAAGGLLEADEVPPCRTLNPKSKGRLLFLCDHASFAVPKALENLGLPDNVLKDHMGWDIGAFEVMQRLAARFDAPGLAGGYSRLVIDLNRPEGDPASIPAVSDATTIPGNQNLSAVEVARRGEALFKPYHRAVNARLDDFLNQGTIPALISVHSFTPALEDASPRKWQVGILWNHDPRIAVPLIERLAANPELCIGDNLPYTGRMLNYTVDTHAQDRGIPHVALELRNDLIATDDGAEKWAVILGDALEDILADPDLYKIEHFI
ncbi:MAG: hypothetical protein HOI33_09095 [Rhodospirillaceae bacterium]|jgi:predicted N-formylglutamate amidohydrolase|nr:hypothetical protein [Rhodospirillaceae bacterium]MBT5752845.1 hypothetical protein [Rhodospirillaceae bacterium]